MPEVVRNLVQAREIIFVVLPALETRPLRQLHQERVRSAQRRKRKPAIGAERSERQRSVQGRETRILREFPHQQFPRHLLLFAEPGAVGRTDFGKERIHELQALEHRRLGNVSQAVIGLVVTPQRRSFGKFASLEGLPVLDHAGKTSRGALCSPRRPCRPEQQSQDQQTAGNALGQDPLPRWRIHSLASEAVPSPP